MSSDEEDFDRVLELSGVFKNRTRNSLFYHHKLPFPHYLEVDNTAQRGMTIFIFEGKAKKEEDAIKQLKDRLVSLKMYKQKYVMQGTVNNFNRVRIFWYTFKKRTIVEYDEKGKNGISYKFSNAKQLMEILQKL